jgi:hypothetical protein
MKQQEKARVIGGPYPLVMRTVDHSSEYVPSVVSLQDRVFDMMRVLVTVTCSIAVLCDAPTLNVAFSCADAVFAGPAVVSVKQLKVKAAPLRPFAGTAVVATQTLVAADPTFPVAAVAGLANIIPGLPAPGYSTCEIVATPFFSPGLIDPQVDAV